MATSFVATDTKPVLRITIRNRTPGGVVPLDLTLASQVLLRFQTEEGLVRERPMFVVDPPTSGEVLYQFATGELEAGIMECEVTVRYTDGRELTTLEPKSFTVRARVT